MDAEAIRQFSLGLGEVEEGFPFGESTLVLKIRGKIFILVSLYEPELSFNVKCDPAKAEDLRESFPENILPGYHMNKKHWNTVRPKGLKRALIEDMITDSFLLVRGKPKRQ